MTEKCQSFIDSVKFGVYDLIRYRLEKRLPAAYHEISIRPNHRTLRGSLIHRFLAQVTAESPANFPTPNDLVQKWIDFCAGRVKSKGLRTSIIKHGSDVMQSIWCEREFRKLPPRLLEKKLRTQLNLNGNSVLVDYGGKIDRIHMLPDEDALKLIKVSGAKADVFDPVEIVDYKTGKAPKPTQYSSRLRLEIQASSYFLLYRRNFGRWPLRATFLYLPEAIRIWISPKEVDFFDLIFGQAYLLTRALLKKSIEPFCEASGFMELHQLLMRWPPDLRIDKIPDKWQVNGATKPSKPRFEALKLFTGKDLESVIDEEPTKEEIFS